MAIDRVVANGQDNVPPGIHGVFTDELTAKRVVVQPVCRRHEALKMSKCAGKKVGLPHKSLGTTVHGDARL
jgi:hypothetical protein